MNRIVMNRIVLVVVAVVALSGCNRKARQAFAFAEAAMAKGDIRNAAVYYHDACKLAPSEAEYCSKARTTGQQVKTDSMMRAKAACDLKNATACLQELEIVEEIAPGADVDALVDEAARIHDQHCREIPLEGIENAVYRVRCIESLSKRVKTTGFQQLRATERAEAGGYVASIATQERARPAAQLALTGLALCLHNSPAVAQQASTLTSAVQRALAYRINLQGRGVSVPALCSKLENQFQTRAVCDSAGATAAFIDARPGPVRDQVSDAWREQEYVARVEEYENPEYYLRLREYERAQREDDRAERNARVASADCETARSVWRNSNSCQNCRAQVQKEQFCRRSDEYDEVWRNRRNRLNHARNIVNNTPQLLQRNIMAIYRYVERTHHYEVPIRGSVRVGTQEKQIATLLSKNSVEQVGSLEAGVRSLTATPPSYDEINDALQTSSEEVLFQVIEGDLQRWSNQQSGACTNVDPRGGEGLACWAEATWRAGKSVPSTYVEWIGSRLTARSDLPQWPKAPCDGNLN